MRRPPRKAATARRFVKAIASQHASGAMWRLPKQTRPSRGLRQPRGLDPRCGARGAPRTRPPHRPDWQRPFRDGRAGRSRGPCRRGVASTGRLGRAGLRAAGQCVSAWGRNSNAGSAEQASVADRNGCESWGRSLPRPLGPGRHRWSGHRSGQGRSGRPLPGAHHLGPVSGTGSRVAPGSGPGGARWRRGRRGDARASASVRALSGGRNGDEVTAPRLAVLRLRGLDTAQGCQLIPACAPAVWAGSAGIATANFADWRADGERAVISRGVDGEVFYLWVRLCWRRLSAGAWK